MPKTSAGLLMYRLAKGQLQVFLVHPGGPFWEKRDLGVWSLPKGEIGAGEEALEAAKREFEEETGFRPAGEFLPLSSLKQPGGKTVSAWAFEGDCDSEKIRSNRFTLEWPPRSGQQREFPEIDRAGWFAIPDARAKILAGQVGFLEDLASKLAQRIS